MFTSDNVNVTYEDIQDDYRIALRNINIKWKEMLEICQEGQIQKEVILSYELIPIDIVTCFNYVFILLFKDVITSC